MTLCFSIRSYMMASVQQRKTQNVVTNKTECNRQWHSSVLSQVTLTWQKTRLTSANASAIAVPHARFQLCRKTLCHAAQLGYNSN